MAPLLPFALRALVTRNGHLGDNDASQHKFHTYYVIGIVIAVLLVAGASLWLVIRRFRKKAAWRREREERVRELNVRGLVRNNGEKKRCVFLHLATVWLWTYRNTGGALPVMLSP